jgi:hypothetical protein
MNDINPSSTPSINVAGDWAEKDRQHTALAESIRPANKAALFEALASAGVTMVLVRFDGCGDSGQMKASKPGAAKIRSTCPTRRSKSRRPAGAIPKLNGRRSRPGCHRATRLRFSRGNA